MERFIKGDVVVALFPFSDLTQAKSRPALVITVLEGNDLILCQITSQSIKDNYTVSLDDRDFKKGSLKKPSNIRPNRLFTAESHIIQYKIGSLKNEKLIEVIQKIVGIIQAKKSIID